MSTTFHAHEVALKMAVALRPCLEALCRHDRDLASQLRRAAASVVLNLAEGSGRTGRDRLQHYRIAQGSALETESALRLAKGWGFVDPEMAEHPEALLNRVKSMLWRLTHARP